ncbi:hypothetical protein JCM10213_005032 [Rhodosporidiobolus nylandii]
MGRRDHGYSVSSPSSVNSPSQRTRSKMRAAWRTAIRSLQLGAFCERRAVLPTHVARRQPAFSFLTSTAKRSEGPPPATTGSLPDASSSSTTQTSCRLPAASAGAPSADEPSSLSGEGAPKSSLDSPSPPAAPPDGLAGLGPARTLKPRQTANYFALLQKHSRPSNIPSEPAEDVTHVTPADDATKAESGASKPEPWTMKLPGHDRYHGKGYTRSHAFGYLVASARQGGAIVHDPTLENDHSGSFPLRHSAKNFKNLEDVVVGLCKAGHGSLTIFLTLAISGRPPLATKIDLRQATQSQGWRALIRAAAEVGIIRIERNTHLPLTEETPGTSTSTAHAPFLDIIASTTSSSRPLRTYKFFGRAVIHFRPYLEEFYPASLLFTIPARSTPSAFPLPYQKARNYELETLFQRTMRIAEEGRARLVMTARLTVPGSPVIEVTTTGETGEDGRRPLA